MDHIEPKIDQVGTWVLSEHGLTTVTNNPAESMNALLKRALERKEVFVDKLVMILYRLSSSINTEILRGRYGLGITIFYQNLPLHITSSETTRNYQKKPHSVSKRSLLDHVSYQ